MSSSFFCFLLHKVKYFNDFNFHCTAFKVVLQEKSLQILD
jgi:hypothetical protein